MALTQRSEVVGLTAKFFRSGAAYTVPSAGTAGEGFKPGDADPAWVSFGSISVGSISKAGEEIKIFAPSPGRKRLKKILTTKDEINVKFTSQEVGRLELQALFGTAPLAGAATSFVPFGGDPLEGWLSISGKNTNDDLVFELTSYAFIRIAGDVPIGDEAMTFEFDASLLDNALNIGAL